MMVSSHATSGCAARFVVAPDGERHHRLRHQRGVVAAVERQVRPGAVELKAVVQIAGDQLSRDLPGIGIEQQLVGIEAVPLVGLVRPVDAIAVVLPCGDVGEMPVPHVAGSLRQRDARELAAVRAVEQAQLDLFGVRGEQREVGPATVDGRAQRMRRAGREPHASAPAPDRSPPAAERSGAARAPPLPESWLRIRHCRRCCRRRRPHRC